jgi:hypothetical protein
MKDYFKQVVSNVDITEEDYKSMSIEECLELITRIRLLAKCDSKYCMTVASLRFILHPFKFTDYSKEVMREYWTKETPQVHVVAETLTFKDISREIYELKSSIKQNYKLATYENACIFNDLVRRYNYIINSLLSKDRDFLDESDLKLRELI